MAKGEHQGRCEYKIVGNDLDDRRVGPERKRGVSIMDDANNPAERASSAFVGREK
jgi:hypothetical protein